MGSCERRSPSRADRRRELRPEGWTWRWPLTRRSMFERLAGAVGGLALGHVGHARAVVAASPHTPFQQIPTEGLGISPYGFRSPIRDGGALALAGART